MSSAVQAGRAAYLRRILSVYLFRRSGPLAFWYETPELNERAFGPGIGEYYMTFSGKARYRGPFDAEGVPLLHYRGEIGLQHNPIAIAQYGLACFNRYLRTSDPGSRRSFLRASDWLCRNLERNRWGLPVWHHHFDWPYREILRSPWYSGLAQGQGLSLLVRAALDTGRSEYGEAAAAAFTSFTTQVGQGGVVLREADGSFWIEEYLVDPPTHILNGFLWALWGVWDFARWSDDPRACEIFLQGADTLARNLPRYDTGSWSLYELSGTGRPMLASPYYHRLHVVQLRVLHRLTGDPVFLEYARRWGAYYHNLAFRGGATLRKAWFKLRHY